MKLCKSCVAFDAAAAEADALAAPFAVAAEAVTAVLALGGKTRCCSVLRMSCIKLPLVAPLAVLLEALGVAPTRLDIAF
jgi:hypothetical protein